MELQLNYNNKLQNKQSIDKILDKIIGRKKNIRVQ